VTAFVKQPGDRTNGLIRIREVLQGVPHGDHVEGHRNQRQLRYHAQSNSLTVGAGGTRRLDSQHVITMTAGFIEKVTLVATDVEKRTSCWRNLFNTAESSYLLGKTEQAPMFRLINRLLRYGVLVFVIVEGRHRCAKATAALTAPD